MSLPALSQDELIEAALIEAAREDPVIFNDYVLRDERTGEPTESCGMHREWHKQLDKLKRVQLLTHVESGKTCAIDVGRVLWELGRDPDLRVVIGCNTQGQSNKVLGVLAHYIERSAELHKVFPNLKRDPAGSWNQTALSVVRSAASKDPSVQAVGLHGNILGARIDLLILDDICDYENSRTTAARDDLDRWLRSTLLGRLTGDSRAWILGNVWHKDDQYSRFEQSGWKTSRYPVTGGLLGRPRWPQRWPPSRIDSTRKDLGAREAGRQLDCIPPDEADPVIPSELIYGALKLGENSFFDGSARDPATFCMLGVDTASSESRTADETALVLVRASRSPRSMREIVQVETGRWRLDEIERRITDLATTSGAVVPIETNNAGEFLAQRIERTKIPVLRFPTTATNKRLRIEKLISEMGIGRWSFAQPGFLHPQLKKLSQEMLSFSFEEHMGDRLAALLMALEGIQKHEVRPKGRCFDASFLLRR